MCLLICGVCELSKKIFIGFIRDEYYKRNFERTKFNSESKLIMGRDLRSGGSWLAMNQDLKISAVLNIRLSADQKNIKLGQSRGHLYQKYLCSDNTIDDLVEQLEKEDDPNYYNLFLGDLKEHEFFCFSKAGNNSDTSKTSLPFCISNQILNERWEKTDRALEQVESINDDKQPVSHEKVHSILSNKEKSKDLPKTGIEPEIEKMLSSNFLQSEIFGTVCSTSMIVDVESNEVELHEIGYSKNGEMSYTESIVKNFSG